MLAIEYFLRQNYRNKPEKPRFYSTAKHYIQPLNEEINCSRKVEVALDGIDDSSTVSKLEFSAIKKLVKEGDIEKFASSYKKREADELIYLSSELEPRVIREARQYNSFYILLRNKTKDEIEELAKQKKKTDRKNFLASCKAKLILTDFDKNDETIPKSPMTPDDEKSSQVSDSFVNRGVHKQKDGSVDKKEHKR